MSNINSYKDILGFNTVYFVIVMFRLMIVRMRPESGNSTYVTGRRPTRALEVQ